MKNLIENNAYRVLGLDVTVNQKDILRRYKEIINRLKIEDVPKYDLDINLPINFRDEEAVNNALRDLQNQRNNIKEFFFWFQISNKDDKKFLGYITREEYNSAIKFLKELAKTDAPSSFFYKKNLAILYCLLLSKDDDERYLIESLSIWYEITKSEKFWNTFMEKYSALDKQTRSKDNVILFKNEVVKDISDIYTSLGQKHKNPNYIKEFQEKFNVLGQEAEKEVLKPTLNLINEKILELQKIEIVRDDTQIEWKVKDINNIMAFIYVLFDRLKKNGLYNTDEAKVIRDHVAEVLRAKAIDINNQVEEHHEVSKLFGIAEGIAGTESYKDALRADIEKVNKFIEADKNSIVSVRISGFLLGSRKFAEFKPQMVEHGDKKIFYKDVTQIMYNAIRTNYRTTYYFKISDGNNQISLIFSDLMAYRKVLGIAYSLIIPRIVKRYVDSIFDEGKSITIGEVEISKRGYSRKKFFGGTDLVSWKDTIFTPVINAGNIILYKEGSAGKSKVFSLIPMAIWNAVVIPALIKECVNKAYALGLIEGINSTTVSHPVKPMAGGIATSDGEKRKEYDDLYKKRQDTAVRKIGREGWESYSGAKYYIIKNKKTGKWDICSNNNSNPPLEKAIWAGNFKSEEEAETYLKNTLQKIKYGYR